MFISIFCEKVCVSSPGVGVRDQAPSDLAPSKVFGFQSVVHDGCSGYGHPVCLEANGIGRRIEGGFASSREEQQFSNEGDFCHDLAVWGRGCIVTSCGWMARIMLNILPGIGQHHNDKLSG